MIKIPKTDDKLKELANSYFSKIETKIRRKINKLYSNITLQSEKDLRNYIESNLELIIMGIPEKLVDIISDVENSYNSVLLNDDCKKNIEKIFDYSNFTKKHAYDHVKNLGITVCPYCNEQYTLTVVKRKNQRSTRPELDHFFPKSRYPYLAISFFNLIPSCHVCNSLKSDKDFNIVKNLHPFVEGIERESVFSTTLSKVDFINENDSFDITVSSSNPKVKENIKAFLIEERYKYHKDYVREIYRKKFIFNESRIEEIMNLKLFENEDELLNILYGNYLQNDDLHKRSLAKLTRDIFNELNIDT